jgi:putative tricarboxylic transport membrane protein
MRREDLIVAVLCLTTSAVVLFQSVPHYFNDRGSLGSGAYPCYIALLLAICGISIFTQWFRGERKIDAPPFFPRGRAGKLLVFTAGALIAHRVATDLLGFGLASLLLMIFLMRLLGNHRWWTTLLLSFLFVGLVSYTFREWLYMDLPRGFLGY